MKFYAGFQVFMVLINLFTGIFGSYLCYLLCVMLFSTSTLNVSNHSGSWYFKVCPLIGGWRTNMCRPVEGEKCRGRPVLAARWTGFHSFIYWLSQKEVEVRISLSPPRLRLCNDYHET